MKIRKREDIRPINLLPGDTISLKYKDPYGETHTVLTDAITKQQVVDHAIIFDVESGDFPGAVSGIGGAFVKRLE
jgi:hypothetical protein